MIHVGRLVGARSDPGPPPGGRLGIALDVGAAIACREHLEGERGMHVAHRFEARHHPRALASSGTNRKPVGPQLLCPTPCKA